MKSISPILTLVDETTVRGQAMSALIKKYLNISTHFGLRNIGDQADLRLPVLYVEPAGGYTATLVTTNKYEIVMGFNLYWYVADPNPEDVVSLCSSIGHLLEKLFSNNALGDKATGNPPSNNFYNYIPYWTETMKFSFRCLPTFRNPLEGQQGGEWMRLGRASVQIRDWILR